MGDMKQKYEIDASKAIDAINTLKGTVDGYNKKLGEASRMQDKLAKTAEKAQEKLASLKGMSKTTETSFRNMGRVAEQATERMKLFRGEINTLKRRTEALAESSSGAARAIRAFTRSMTSETNRVNSLISQYQQLIDVKDRYASVKSKPSSFQNVDVMLGSQGPNKPSAKDVVTQIRIANYKRIQDAAKETAIVEALAAAESAASRRLADRTVVAVRLENYNRIKAAAEKAARDEQLRDTLMRAKKKALLKEEVADRLAIYNQNKAFAASAAATQALADKIMVAGRIAAFKRMKAAENLDAAKANFGTSTSLTASIVAANLYTRALSAVSSAMRTSVQDAKELSKRIAEIQTVTLSGLPGLRQSARATSDWRTELLALGNSFGVNELEVAEGLYQALSNQVVEAGNSTFYMTENLKLAITTTDRLEDAVSATSTVINAFSKDVSETSYISSVLFKTVEVGRLRLSELGSQFGRVSVLSRDLGITFEEQAGAIALLTRLGLKADSAQTLLTNVQLKLIKPTERMNELFKQWGVTSGQAAIATFGFQGVLQRLAIEVNKGNDELADIGETMRDLRAITGAQGLVGNLGLLNKTIEEVSNGGEDFRKSWELSLESISKRTDIQVEKIRHLFLVQFGEPLLNMLVRVAEGFNGADVALARFLEMGRFGIEVFVAYRTTLAITNTVQLAFAARAATAAGATTALGNAAAATSLKVGLMTGGISLLVGAIAHVAINSQLAASQFDSFLVTVRQSATEDITTGLERINDTMAQTARQAKLTTDITFQRFNLLLSELRTVNTKLEQDFEKSFKAINKSMIDGLTKGVEAASARLKETSDRVKGLTDSIARAKEALTADVVAADDAGFTARLATMDPATALAEIQKRKAALEAGAFTALAKGEEETALAILERAKSLEDELVSRLNAMREAALEAARVIREAGPTGASLEVRNADGSSVRRGRRVVGPRGGPPPGTVIGGTTVKDVAVVADDAKVKEAERALNAIIAEREAREARIFAMRAEMIRMKERELEVEKATEAAQKAGFDQLNKIIPLLDAFDFSQQGASTKFDQLLGQAQVAANAAGMTPAEQLEFFRKAQAQRVMLARQAEQQISINAVDEIQKRLNAERKAIDAAIKARQAANSNIVTNANEFIKANLEAVARLEREFKTTLSGNAMSAQGVDGPNVEVQAQVDTINSLVDRYKELNQQFIDVQKNGGNTDNIFRQIVLTYGNLSQAIKDLDAMKPAGELRRGGIPGFTPAVQQRDNQLLTLPDGNGNTMPIAQILDESERKLRAMNDGFLQLGNATVQINKASLSLQELNNQYNRLDPAVRKRIEAQIELNTISQETELGVQNNLKGTINLMQQIEDLQLRIIQMKQYEATLTPPPPADGVPAFALGGRVGTDTKLIRAAAGEMVMTRSAVRQYAPLLRNMNAGAARSSTSNTNNVNFGDITVQLSSSSTQGQAIEFARQIKRLSNRGVL